MFFDRDRYEWAKLEQIQNRAFVCGRCDHKVSSVLGFVYKPRGSSVTAGGVWICPNCNGPTAIDKDGVQTPSEILGRSIEKLPSDVKMIYEEARLSTGQGCYTGAVMLCRKILMHLAVDKGSKPGLGFVQYIEYLDERGYIPPDGKAWVEHIRTRGNDANHELVVMTKGDAQNLLTFTEMLLKFIYEFPSMVPPETANP